MSQGVGESLKPLIHIKIKIKIKIRAVVQIHSSNGVLIKVSVNDLAMQFSLVMASTW